MLYLKIRYQVDNTNKGHTLLKGEKMENKSQIKSSILELDGVQIPTYGFKLEEYNTTFLSTTPATKMFMNDIERLWKGYDPYPEMSSGAGYTYNEQIIEELKKKGIIQIDIEKSVYDVNILDSKKLIDKNFLSGFITEFSKNENMFKISEFFKQKFENPYVGIFWGIDKSKGLDEHLINELDWLPVPNRKMEYSANIFHYENNAYLVIWQHRNGVIRYFKDMIIGASSCFYDETEEFSTQRMSEIIEIIPNKKLMNLVLGWDFFFINRYKHFFGEHPYKNDLFDEEEINDQDRLRLFLIWLNRLQEFVDKAKELHQKGQTVVMTNDHNEMNGEYVSYNTTYTPEIRKEIIEKRDHFKLYAIANDWFVS